MTSTPGAWELLGTPAPDDLVEARLQLHWAAQIVAAVSAAYARPAPDDSHTSFSWSQADRALITQPLDLPLRIRAALVVPDLQLAVVDERGVTLDAFPLGGHTLREGFAHMQDALRRQLGSYELSVALSQPTLDIPAHPVRSGASFANNLAKPLAELARWYGNAALALETVRKRDSRASPIRTWPHHFDIATLIVLDPDVGSEAGRTIGAGMIPGDADYAEPYFYVTPWPRPPNTPMLPALAGNGAWHTEGWLGALLTASGLVGERDAAAQSRRVETFVESAVAASARLHEHARRVDQNGQPE